MKKFTEYLDEHIVKSGSGYKLLSTKTGKNLGTASSLSGIKKRERQVQYFKHMKEDGVAMGVAPTNSVAGVAGTGDSRLPASQREPGVSKKRNPTLGYFRRKSPKV